VQPFEPELFLVVDSSEQLKAFTDPLRTRVLSLLAEREATNQQLARTLGEPHAKVLHHVRVLLDLNLIRLVDTRIKGGNVEKYYRAVARLFGIRSPPELRPSIAGARFEVLRQDIETSVILWPDQPVRWEMRHARLPPERVDAFYRRLNELIAEYWGDPPDHPPPHADAPLLTFASVIYQDPAGAEKAPDRAELGELPG
jgi:DNA-binding transcriptional ArsR family regulator